MLLLMLSVHSYKQQLVNGLKREQTLEQKVVQLELDWKRHCEDVRAENYIRDKELVESLTFSRDKVGLEKLKKKLLSCILKLCFVQGENQQLYSIGK